MVGTAYAWIRRRRSKGKAEEGTMESMSDEQTCLVENEQRNEDIAYNAMDDDETKGLIHKDSDDDDN